MSNNNGLAPVRVNVTPGRRVIHVHEVHIGNDQSTATRTVRTPYRLVGVAWDTRTFTERIVLAAEDGPDRGGLYLFGLGELSRDFVDADPPQRDAETVEVPAPVVEKVAGHVSTASGV